MFLSYIILALSLSIDSIGIGITYGLRNTHIPLLSKLILFTISIIFTSASLMLGNLLKYILPDTVANIIGSIILIIIGIGVLFQITKNDNSYDLDNSKIIDAKEAFFLSIALSIDSISVSIGSGITGMNSFIFPILVATFHLSFLFFGTFLGKKVTTIKSFPENICNILSGILLILIGISKLFLF